jgi:DNA/RNA-binding domain of Phe-tRNA-synthetase-like protein
MRVFQHANDIWHDFPQLSACVAIIETVSADVDVERSVAQRLDAARGRLAAARESELPEIQAWRRVYTQMGLKPTQYRCAAESLLRRLRTAGDLPDLHPLVNLCNSLSAAYAIPIAVLDLDRIDGSLSVKPADGTERYETFSGDIEHPAPSEIVFADSAGNAHSRRWVTRQCGRSSIRPETRAALIVAEAVHDNASQDVSGLLATLTAELTRYWGDPSETRQLSATSPDAVIKREHPVSG